MVNNFFRRLIKGFYGLCFLTFCFVAGGAAQDDVQRQIDNDVWIPLFAASDKFDADKFLSIYSKDLVRVSVDANQVYGMERFESEIRPGFKRARERGIRRKSEMRFLRRTATGNLAFETGYFRSEAVLANGELSVRYTLFEFILRKEGKHWKILVDKDSTEKGAITEKDFQVATPLKLPS